VANLVGSFLAVSYALEQFRTADASPAGGLVGVEVLTLWVAFEVAVVTVLAVVAVRRRRKKN